MFSLTNCVEIVFVWQEEITKIIRQITNFRYFPVLNNLMFSRKYNVVGVGIRTLRQRSVRDGARGGPNGGDRCGVGKGASVRS